MLRSSQVFWACLATFAGLLLILFNGDDENSGASDRQEQKSEPVYEVMKRIRDVTPDDIVQPPKIETELVERLPAVIPPPPPPKPPKPDKWPRPIVLSAGIIKSGDQTIHLADIRPVKLTQTCDDQSGEPWPCGMLARTEMRMFVRGRAIDCEPVDAAEKDKITTRCQLAAFDMSAWLVLNGWAEPNGDHFAEEFEEAKNKGRGMWRAKRPL